jgi:hypothetical protein
MRQLNAEPLTADRFFFDSDRWRCDRLPRLGKTAAFKATIYQFFLPRFTLPQGQDRKLVTMPTRQKEGPWRRATNNVGARATHRAPLPTYAAGFHDP